MKYAGGGQDTAGVGVNAEPRSKPAVWQHTPRWHWRSWFGYSLRRNYQKWVRNGITEWEYGRPKKVAREALNRTYNPDAPTQQGYSPNIVGNHSQRLSGGRRPKW